MQTLSSLGERQGNSRSVTTAVVACCSIPEAVPTALRTITHREPPRFPVTVFPSFPHQHTHTASVCTDSDIITTLTHSGQKFSTRWAKRELNGLLGSIHNRPYGSPWPSDSPVCKVGASAGWGMNADTWRYSSCVSRNRKSSGEQVYFTVSWGARRDPQAPP